MSKPEYFNIKEKKLFDKSKEYHNLIFKRQRLDTLPSGLLNYRETGFEIDQTTTACK
jgi:hypothetical protein